MFKFRNFLIGAALLGALTPFTHAQSLTQIADTVKNADGSLFTGTAVITWNGSGSLSSGGPYSTSTKIYSGVLSVSLVPTVGYTGYYLVVFNSSDGRTSWVENWQVGLSASPLTLAQVRTQLSSAPSSGTSTSTLSMTQVTGLNSYLNALSSSISTVSSTISNYNSSVATLNGTVSTLNDRVNFLQSNVALSGSSILVEGEVPSGTINGANAAFTIANTPAVASSLSVFRNGVLQAPGVDYSLSGKAISFATGSIPQTSDQLTVSYRMGTPAQNTSFIDNETPLGATDGTNLTFTLSGLPLTGSLRLYKNGAMLLSGTDYTLNGATVTFVSASATAASGDTLRAYYRVSGN